MRDERQGRAWLGDGWIITRMLECSADGVREGFLDPLILVEETEYGCYRTFSSSGQVALSEGTEQADYEKRIPIDQRTRA